MKYKAEVEIMPHTELLDPQGKAVMSSLHKMQYEQVKNVRIGKMIMLEIEAETEHQAKEIVEATCQKLLVNHIMEQYRFRISAI